MRVDNAGARFNIAWPGWQLGLRWLSPLNSTESEPLLDPDNKTESPFGERSGGATTVAVTGASGFVGTAVVKALSEKGVNVRALSRTEPKDLPVGAQWFQSPDLDHRSAWGHLLAGCSVVIHCAARVHMMNDGASDPLSEFRRVNCVGTVKLARDAVAVGVGRFVFMSSIKVNGEQTEPGEPFRATDSPAPVDAYGMSKREAEDELFRLARSSAMQLAVIRPVLVYGPGVRANFAALSRLVAKGIPLPFGLIRNERSMVYVENLADLVSVVAFHPKAADQVFLVSDGRDLSTAEIVRKLSASMGCKARLMPVPRQVLTLPLRLLGKEAVAQRLFRSLTVDIEPTCDLLSWKPRYSVDQGFADTVRSCLNEGER